MPKPKKETYTYPDKDDKITGSLIKQFPEQWQNEENQILNQIETYIKEKPRSWLLDAGCGTGRLLPRFQGFFDQILAVDPDFSQIEKAMLLVKEQGFTQKVTFKISAIEELNWSSESFDVILCSHIIQHTNTDLVSLILQKLNMVAKPDGLLFLLVSYSEGQDYYAKDELCNGVFCETQISKEDFNALIDNKQGKLPVHFFSLETLREQLQKAGFSIVDYSLFHSSDGPVASARDIFVVGKKVVSKLQ
ncbi:MAG: class I SAM-dependent methyltransferase [Candidatus Bathyarchaeota archaeon]|nr:class I SAM-dependent methyltransferase [Candidatus Bathyarchaeota archaeon]